MDDNKEVILELCRELKDLCREKGLDGEEIFIIGCMTNDAKTVAKYGEEMAFKMVIEAIKLCNNDSEMIFYAVERVLGIR